MTKPNPLTALFTAARHAQSNKVLYDHNGDVRAVIPSKPMERSIIDLNGDLLPNIETDDGTGLKRSLVGRPAVEVTTIGAAVIKQSLVAQAGAQVIIWEDKSTTVPIAPANMPSDLDRARGRSVDAEIAMVSRPAYFETFEAAPFALVPDGQEVVATPLPIKRAQIHVDTDHGLQTGTAIYGLRFEFDRATMKNYPNFENAVMHAITQGLARTGDAVLLGAIVASAPAQFSLSAAAAAAVRFGELRALVGTAAAGAIVGQDGVLRAAGIAAELTPDMAATVVGTFARSAIMIRSDVEVVAERVKIDGSVAFTAWAALQPLLPDTSRFWTVGA
ncbi:hypothetical protein [Burkholderia pseudomallei]|uniref:hypothetical protein n=1 Tax=Burkholderia pseudomallei TaxID=28450 RepID=UPI000531564C|nr:hypothetical protein [Burkholderia pseudomallei]KGS21611.1 hypothetical protein X941_5548 [Burkholderia pseudomallei MSHR5569]